MFKRGDAVFRNAEADKIFQKYLFTFLAISNHFSIAAHLSGQYFLAVSILLHNLRAAPVVWFSGISFSLK